MTKFAELCDSDLLYKCDKCPATFKTKEMLLKEAATNVHFLTPLSSLIAIDKNGIVMKGGKAFKPGDRTLACPKCKTTHLFGFNKVL